MDRRIPVPRYIFGGPAQLSQARGAVNTAVSVRNISTHGCCVRGLGLESEGDICELIIKWQGKEFRCEVSVRWRNERGEGGLEFLHMDETRLAVLRQLFSTLRLEPPRVRTSNP